ncbi:MAG: putative 4-hydroxybenzoate polyprenyltransferase [Candidatus Thermoplasmatota archaeon]|nr:putative 4-hydroxybenzoate polyprenyltransferase [Candidatus Thermoplasmatota archaeon]MCL5987390.1 putative 4-hydroxybenzoate polyprenyltransferase [Candidatus Thermoplasmatota archaeon]
MAGNTYNEQGHRGKSGSTEEVHRESVARNFVDFIKLEHTVFDLPFIVSGSFIAAGTFPGLRIIVLVLLAGTLARAAAMGTNRIMGRKYDQTNPRKSKWGLVNGNISTKNALLFVALMIGLFEIDTYFINGFVLMLSPIVLSLFIIDPFLKRITPWRHFFMGVTIGVGVMAGYLAVIPSFPSSPAIYILVLATGIWIAGFDMIYTIPDIEHDRRNNLKTVMTRYGVNNGMKISSMTHAVTLGLFTLLLIYINSYYYAVALIIIYILIIYQHIIVDPEKPGSIRVSFLNSNSFIGMIFLASLILSQYFPLILLPAGSL